MGAILILACTGEKPEAEDSGTQVFENPFADLESNLVHRYATKSYESVHLTSSDAAFEVGVVFGLPLVEGELEVSETFDLSNPGQAYAALIEGEGVGTCEYREDGYYVARSGSVTVDFTDRGGTYTATNVVFQLLRREVVLDSFTGVVDDWVECDTYEW